MIKAKSLYHLILYSIIFIVILISFFTFIIIENAFDDFQEKIEIIKTDYASKQKYKIKNEIENVINFIDFYDKKYKDVKSQKEIQKDILEAIENMRDKNKKDNYLFIYNYSGMAIYNPASKELVGKNLLNYTDKTGKKLVKELINVSKDNSGGYVEYLWINHKEKREVKKILVCLVL